MKILKSKWKEQQSENFVAFFLSDLHLSKQEPQNFEVLNAWLEDLSQKKVLVHLYFLGDIFDLWVGTASPVKNLAQKTLKTLKGLQAQGSKIVFFEGNHDLHLDAYFTKTWGFPVIKENLRTEIVGFKLCLEHGDLFDPEDKGYLFLRKFLRLAWVRFFLLYIAPDFLISLVGDYFSKKSSKKTRRYSQGHTQDVQDKLKSYSLNRLQSDEDIFICGHTHQRCELSLSENKTLINLGTWQKQDQILILGLAKNQTFHWLKL